VRERLLAVIRYNPLWCSRHKQPALPDKTEPQTADSLDADWYFRAYRKIWPAALARPKDALEHYRRYGATFALSPHLAFDEYWYRQRYADVDTLVRCRNIASAWEHYVQAGCSERRDPVWWFDEEWYEAKNPDARQAMASGQFVCGFEHYLLYGMRQDFSPSLYFDPGWYRSQYLCGVDGRDTIPLVHYLLDPDRGNRCPVGFFDPEWYVATYLPEKDEHCPEAPRRWHGPYEHYIFWGRSKLSSPSPGFDERAYRELNPEAADAIGRGRYLTGFEHYIQEGASTGCAAIGHLGTAGVDYAGPALLKACEKSLLLNLKQIKTLKRLASDAF
jgi:hypothetical protein